MSTSLPHRSVARFALTAVIAVISVAYAVQRIAVLRRSGEEGARVWFYDESEKRLYPAPADTVPPHAGIGGARGDGVRAYAVTFGDQGLPVVAYLQTCAPELKAVLEQARTARQSGKPLQTAPPARDSEFYQAHTLVRKITDATWHPSNTDEARTTLNEWRTWRGPNGEAPQVSAP